MASNKVLKVAKAAPQWKAYVEYVNNIVIEGIADTIINSLQVCTVCLPELLFACLNYCLP